MNNLIIFFIFFIHFCYAQSGLELEEFRRDEDMAVQKQIQQDFNLSSEKIEVIIDALSQKQNEETFFINTLDVSYSAFIYFKHSSSELANAVFKHQMQSFQSQNIIKEDIVSYLQKSLATKLKKIDLSASRTPFVSEQLGVEKNRWLQYFISQINYPLNFAAMKDLNTIINTLKKGTMGGIFIDTKDILLLNDERIAKVLIEVALDIKNFIENPNQASQSSIHIDEFFLNRLSQYGFTRAEAQKTLATLLGLYAQRGAAWTSSAIHGIERMNEQLKHKIPSNTALKASFCAMSYIASGISVIDKVQWKTHGKLFSLPRTIKEQNLLTGKPYYFWLSYYLTKQVKNPSIATIKAVALLNELYQLTATFNGRDPLEIVRVKDKGSNYVVGRSVDVVNGLLGSMYATNNETSFFNIWTNIRKNSQITNLGNLNFSFVYDFEKKLKFFQDIKNDGIMYSDNDLTAYTLDNTLYLFSEKNKKTTALSKIDYSFQVYSNDQYLILQGIYKNEAPSQGASDEIKIKFFNKANQKLEGELSVPMETFSFLSNGKFFFKENNQIYTYAPGIGKKPSNIPISVFEDVDLFNIIQSNTSITEKNIMFTSFVEKNDHRSNFLNILNTETNNLISIKQTPELEEILLNHDAGSASYKIINNKIFFYQIQRVKNNQININKFVVDLVNEKIIEHKNIEFDNQNYLAESLSVDDKGLITIIAKSNNTDQLTVLEYIEATNGRMIINREIFKESISILDKAFKYFREKIFKTAPTTLSKDVFMKLIAPNKSLYLNTPDFTPSEIPLSFLFKINKAYDALVPVNKVLKEVFKCNSWFKK